ncbi:alternative ribosome rescue aminoacyl-tRNA hydrolase ArfB [Salibacteraceae bacterium]|jgi:ribosome-associated protein|nr:aminoacyl-tRNA hydrolase [Flavobacteriales bacterium]MDC1202494.1 alternative ribosome rescue aminoacyl-tRNA hydrolase ArfB [Salibacteraceae bacterium]
MFDSNTFEKELKFRTSRSGGPGGQSVNKTETRVEVMFDIAASKALSESQKEIIKIKLGNRISSSNIISLAVSEKRGQLENKGLAINRLHSILEDALTPEKRRIPSKPSKASKTRRIESKNRRSELKSSRRWKPD